MKLNSTARLAVTAGICAAVLCGSMPLSAIADEVGAEIEPIAVETDNYQGGHH